MIEVSNYRWGHLFRQRPIYAFVLLMLLARTGLASGPEAASPSPSTAAPRAAQLEEAMLQPESLALNLIQQALRRQEEIFRGFLKPVGSRPEGGGPEMPRRADEKRRRGKIGHVAKFGFTGVLELNLATTSRLVRIDRASVADWKLLEHQPLLSPADLSVSYRIHTENSSDNVAFPGPGVIGSSKGRAASGISHDMPAALLLTAEGGLSLLTLVSVFQAAWVGDPPEKPYPWSPERKLGTQVSPVYEFPSGKYPMMPGGLFLTDPAAGVRPPLVVEELPTGRLVGPLRLGKPTIGKVLLESQSGESAGKMDRIQALFQAEVESGENGAVLRKIAAAKKHLFPGRFLMLRLRIEASAPAPTISRRHCLAIEETDRSVCRLGREVVPTVTLAGPPLLGQYVIKTSDINAPAAFIGKDQTLRIQNISVSKIDVPELGRFSVSFVGEGASPGYRLVPFDNHFELSWARMGAEGAAVPDFGRPILEFDLNGPNRIPPLADSLRIAYTPPGGRRTLVPVKVDRLGRVIAAASDPRGSFSVEVRADPPLPEDLLFGF